MPYVVHIVMQLSAYETPSQKFNTVEFTITLLFKSHPTANSILTAYMEDKFLQKLERAPQILETLRSRLQVWGVPNLPPDGRGVDRVFTHWIANTNHEDGTSLLSTNFGHISVCKKEIN